MQSEKVRVLRAFYFAGKPLSVGAIVELPKLFAREVIAAGKAVAYENEEAPPKPETKSKGDQHAR